MEIGPMNNYQPKPVEAIKGIPQGGKTQVTAQPADTVQISLQARLKLAELADQALQETLKIAPPPGTVYSLSDLKKAEADNESSPIANGNKTMLEQVQHRIKTGFYNRPEVKAEIAEKLADELGKPASEPE
jgi:hypothetical protein